MKVGVQPGLVGELSGAELTLRYAPDGTVDAAGIDRATAQGKTIHVGVSSDGRLVLAVQAPSGEPVVLGVFRPA